jgi:hypothetical protein
MFGMLDYRAHKLLWLIFLPISLGQRLIIYGIAAAAALLVQSQFAQYHLLAMIAIAVVGFELTTMFVMWLVFAPINWIIKSVFFWIIDVVPARGTDPEEAKVIVLLGPRYELDKKLNRDIGNWTDADTASWVALQNWRSRWLFPIEDRMRFLVREFRDLHECEGKQPGDFDPSCIMSVANRFPGRKVTWFERTIVSPYGFNSIVAVVIIALILWSQRW